MVDPKSVLAAAGAAEPDPMARNLGALAERFDGEWVRHLKGFIRYYGFGYDVGGTRPSRKFFEALLGHGAEGCSALLDRYFEETRGERSADETRKEVDALLTVTRTAQAARAISWDVNNWKPGEYDESRRRVVAYVEPSIDEKLRRLAFESRSTVSRVVESALTERIEKHEKKHGPLAPREAVTA